MAVTNKKDSKNSRLDFGEALDKALFVDNKQKGDVDASIRLRNMNDINSEPTTQTLPHQIPQQIPQQIENNTTRGMPIQSIQQLKAEIADDEIDDDADLYLSLVKGGRGYQRSVYFESDVYQYIQAKSIKYNVKFSNIVNMLIKEMIYKKRQ